VGSGTALLCHSIYSHSLLCKYMHIPSYSDEIMVGSLRAPHLPVSLRCLRTFLILELCFFCKYCFQFIFGHFQFNGFVFDSSVLLITLSSQLRAAAPHVACMRPALELPAPLASTRGGHVLCTSIVSCSG